MMDINFQEELYIFNMKNWNIMKQIIELLIKNI